MPDARGCTRSGVSSCIRAVTVAASATGYNVASPADEAWPRMDTRHSRRKSTTRGPTRRSIVDPGCDAWTLLYEVKGFSRANMSITTPPIGRTGPSARNRPTAEPTSRLLTTASAFEDATGSAASSASIRRSHEVEALSAPTGAKVPLPGHPVPGPYRDRPHPVGDEMEARAQRFCHHLRRPVPGRRDLLTPTPETPLALQAPNPTAGNTVGDTDPHVLSQR
jgi:hypothetical protein